MFAAKGYDSVSIRAIARSLDIDPALIHHYFGTKKELFATAVQETALTLYRFEGLEKLPPTERVHSLITRVDTALASPNGSVLIAMLRSILNSGVDFSDKSGQQFPVAKIMQIMEPTTELGASLAFTQLSGAIIARYITRLPAIVQLSTRQLADYLTPTLYRYLYEELPR